MSLMGPKHPSVFYPWHQTHLICMLRDPIEGDLWKKPFLHLQFPPWFSPTILWGGAVSQHPCLCANHNTHKHIKGSDKSCSKDTRSVFPRFVCPQHFFLRWPFPYPMPQGSGNTLWDPLTFLFSIWGLLPHRTNLPSFPVNVMILTHFQ